MTKLTLNNVVPVRLLSADSTRRTFLSQDRGQESSSHREGPVVNHVDSKD